MAQEIGLHGIRINTLSPGVSRYHQLRHNLAIEANKNHSIFEPP